MASKVHCDLCDTAPAGPILKDSNRVDNVLRTSIVVNGIRKIVDTKVISHTVGDGPDPDLCINCWRQVIDAIREKIAARAEL